MWIIWYSLPGLFFGSNPNLTPTDPISIDFLQSDTWWLGQLPRVVWQVKRCQSSNSGTQSSNKPQTSVGPGFTGYKKSQHGRVLPLWRYFSCFWKVSKQCPNLKHHQQTCIKLVYEHWLKEAQHIPNAKCMLCLGPDPEVILDGFPITRLHLRSLNEANYSAFFEVWHCCSIQA